MGNSCLITEVSEAKALPIKEQKQSHSNNIKKRLIIVFLSQMVKIDFIENW
jgi:hypothetical protein